MNKNIYCVISAPVDTWTGYGRRSLDLVKELVKQYPDWTIEILSQPWGTGRMGYLSYAGEEDIMSRLISKVTVQPDVWIQITVPNEFQAVGKFNIGITAAMETTVSDSSWVQGCNKMDLIIVSSEHGKYSLTNSKYTNQKTGEALEVTTPIEVLFEGLDISKYFKKNVSAQDSILSDVKTPWNYLFLGQWLRGDFGHDRKNVGYTIKMFLETFKDKKDAPGLILKTTLATSSIMDRELALKRIYDIRETVKYNKSLPEIYLLYGDLSDTEINNLYNDPKVKAMVSFTKGEGFGRPLLEFAAIGKPIVCSGWSGQLDFLDKENTAMVGGTLEKVHPSAAVSHMILEEASWFRPDDKQVMIALSEVFSNYSTWKSKASKQASKINKVFTLNSMGIKLKQILDKNIPNFPEEVKIILPEVNE